MTIKTGTALGTLIALFSIYACNSSPPSSGPDAVVARVNDTALTVADLTADIPTNLVPDAVSKMKRDWVEQWIQSELLYQEAVRQNLNQDRKIARELQKMQRDYLANLLLERILSQNSANVTDAEIESYYRGHQSDFIRTEPELRLSVIVLDSEQDARETWKLLSRREKDFESMAREQSADAVSSEKDGDLGYVKKSDIGIRKVQDTVFSLRAGQLSQPIQTETGYCIFKVNDRHESGSIRPLEEVRGEIVNRVLEERRRNRIKQFVEDIRKESEVEVHEDLINEAAANSTAMQ